MNGAIVQLNWKNWNLVCDILTDYISHTNPARAVETYSDTCGEEGPTYIELTIEGLVIRHGDLIVSDSLGKILIFTPRGSVNRDFEKDVGVIRDTFSHKIIDEEMENEKENENA